MKVKRKVTKINKMCLTCLSSRIFISHTGEPTLVPWYNAEKKKLNEIMAPLTAKYYYY